MASEGVNLHKECHVLFHWHLPWSLIRIQQRNGHIDRYGQRHAPVITALVTVPEDPETAGDARIIANLLHKEDAAHRGLSDAAAVMGEWDEIEEAQITKVLASRATADERAEAVDGVAPTPGDDDDAWAWKGPMGEILASGTSSTTGDVPVRRPERLFDAVQHRQDMERERSLLYVAATRARDQLSISWHGAPSPFLESVVS